MLSKSMSTTPIFPLRLGAFARDFFLIFSPFAKSYFTMIVGAGFPDNGLGLESPATFQSERS